MAGEHLSPKQPDHEGGKMINAGKDALLPFTFKQELVGEVSPVHWLPADGAHVEAREPHVRPLAIGEGNCQML
jgi:hypothetical protein